MKAKQLFGERVMGGAGQAKLGRLYVDKEAAMRYFANVWSGLSRQPSNVPEQGLRKRPTCELSSNGRRGELDLDFCMSTLGGEPDPKTASIAISTEDDVFSLSEPWGCSLKASVSSVLFYPLQHLVSFPFPCYGIREKASQTDISAASSDFARCCSVLGASPRSLCPLKKSILLPPPDRP